MPPKNNRWPDFTKITRSPAENPLDPAEFPGLFPFTRGPYASMYIGRPWTIRQYAGFSTAEESNAFYRRNLAGGQLGLSVAFDLATHRGYDSDHPRVVGDVGKAGVAISSVEDMKILFSGIPLDQMSVSMTMNGAVLPVLAFFIVAGREQGVPETKLQGTIQNDILKEYMVRNTYIYPPEPSLRIIGDIIKFCTARMPRFNPISISGYHIQEAGGSADLELAYTLCDGLEYVRVAREAGLDLDSFAGRFSFFWGLGMNLPLEVAKLRAGRRLWARWLQAAGARQEKTMALRTHCQTSGYSLTAAQPFNNIARTTLEALAGVLGHTQSLHTNSLDEALALPSDFSARIARNTQIILAEETGLTAVVDPLYGSREIENATDELCRLAEEHKREIDSAGGMAMAIEKGIPQSRIERSAAIRQAHIDSGEEVVVGLNRHRANFHTTLAILEVDNDKVLASQLARLRALREQRDNHKVRRLLDNLTRAAADKSGNLIEAAIEAASARATLGEMSLALEKTFGRYATQRALATGIYSGAYRDSEALARVRALVAKFHGEFGRNPRILLAKMGQDGHDRGVKVIATAFADMGFDIDLSPLFQTPEEVARAAMENDVHFIGVSSLAGGHKTLVSALAEILRREELTETAIVVGGIIPENDIPYLEGLGVMAVFPPGSHLPGSAEKILIEYFNKYKLEYFNKNKN